MLGPKNVVTDESGSVPKIFQNQQTIVSSVLSILMGASSTNLK